MPGNLDAAGFYLLKKCQKREVKARRQRRRTSRMMTVRIGQGLTRSIRQNRDFVPAADLPGLDGYVMNTVAATV
jgi:hypothetical protein